MVRRKRERGIGDIAERMRDLIEIPAAGDVGERDQQRGAPARPAQHAHQPRGIAVLPRADEFCEQIGQDSRGILG
jgi:hypothetical protein